MNVNPWLYWGVSWNWPTRLKAACILLAMPYRANTSSPSPFEVLIKGPCLPHVFFSVEFLPFIFLAQLKKKVYFNALNFKNVGSIQHWKWFKLDLLPTITTVFNTLCYIFFLTINRLIFCFLLPSCLLNIGKVNMKCVFLFFRIELVPWLFLIIVFEYVFVCNIL